MVRHSSHAVQPRTSAQEKVQLFYVRLHRATPAVYSVVVELIEEYERLNPHVEIIELGGETAGDVLLLKTMSPNPGYHQNRHSRTDKLLFNGSSETAPDSLTEILKRSYYPVAVESLMFGGELKGYL